MKLQFDVNIIVEIEIENDTTNINFNEVIFFLMIMNLVEVLNIFGQK